MVKSFYKLSMVVQAVLVLVPFVGWVTEMVLRWSTFLNKKDLVSLLVALFFTFTSWFYLPCLVDGVHLLLKKRLILL